MRTLYINKFIKKVQDSKNAGVRGEIKIPIDDAIGAVLELSLILTDNHLISFEDLKEALLNSKHINNDSSKKITGGTF